MMRMVAMSIMASDVCTAYASVCGRSWALLRIIFSSTGALLSLGSARSPLLT